MDRDGSEGRKGKGCFDDKDKLVTDSRSDAWDSDKTLKYKLAGPCMPDIYLDGFLSAPRIPRGPLSACIVEIGASRPSVVNNVDTVPDLSTSRKKVCPPVRVQTPWTDFIFQLVDHSIHTHPNS